MTVRRSTAFAILALLTAGCAGGSDERNVAQAVEPSLRAAAAQAEASSDYKGAAQHWGTIYQRHPEDREVVLALARALRYGGQAQQGADIIQAHLARKPRDPEAVLELGKDYLAADRIGLAIKAFEEARELAADRWEVHSALAVALDTQGRYADAAESYGRALQLSPGNPAVLNNLGLNQALAGRLDTAIATLSQAADHPQAGAQIRQNLALLTALKGDAATAEKLVRRDLPPEMARTNSEILRALAAGARGM